MPQQIRVAILDDHQTIIDGYKYRLGQSADVEVVATARFGEELGPLLDQHQIDLLLLDVHVPTSKDNQSPYPILHLIPKLLQQFPNLVVLVISMYAQRSLIKAVMEAGASGYILKEDRPSIRELESIVRSVARGGIYFSQQAHEKLQRPQADDPILTQRQREVLSVSAAYPDLTAAELALKLNVANSTVRNLLSGAYLRLGVRNRAAALSKAQRLGLITPLSPTVKITAPE